MDNQLHLSSARRSLAEQSAWELQKLVRLIRLVRRRGDRHVCQHVLAHARRIRTFIRQQQYSQALHVARCRMKG
jgi:hypothetical protein